MPPRPYRKRPVEIEAWEFVTEDIIKVAAWCKGKARINGTITITTLEGEMTAQPGDFIIKGVNNEFYPCKPDIFAKTYEYVWG